MIDARVHVIEKDEETTSEKSYRKTELRNPEGTSHVSNQCLLEKKLKKDFKEHHGINYMGWFIPYDNNQEAWDKNEVYALALGPEHMDMGSDSSDTFNEFTYEEEVLDKIEGYYTEELAAKEIGLYDNLWQI
ncbi:35624_t:CDS:2 [Gigaspora margarita]|uniref:35624_t:CDS:1 n=1 Tax=Gigaspora margarita TaxID=4874 RepID=A0ABN7VH63_GIGMA|nr:35624_t:CDS:2 [Gigaspora margarita]